jgi:hypothetical protein
VRWPSGRRVGLPYITDRQCTRTPSNVHSPFVVRLTSDAWERARPAASAYNQAGEGTETKIRLTAISFALTIAAVAYLLVVPVYSGGGTVTKISGSDVRSNVYSSRATLLQVNGLAALIPALLPAVIALLPLLFRYQAVRIIAAVLLFGFVVIAGFSFGFLYLPAATLMLLAACVRPAVKDADQ